MKTYKSVVSETKDISEVKDLIGVYEELSALKMQEIRHDILISREYFEGLRKLSDEVGSDFSVILPPLTIPKKAAVFISANSGLYGDIVDKIFMLFLDYIKQNHVDTFVIGKLGAEIMRQHAPGITFTELALKDDKIAADDFHEIFTKISGYHEVSVFYGKFQNLVRQDANTGRVSSELISAEQKRDPDALRKKHFQNLYEPTLETVSEIFANEIFLSVFEAMVRESQLARLAARLMNLDQSIDTIDTRLIALGAQRQAIRKKINNRKQNAMISGIMART